MNEAQEVKLKKVGEKGNINGFKNRLKVYNDWWSKLVPGEIDR